MSSPSAIGGGWSVALVLAVYCASGPLLTLANKLAVTALPAPHALLALQNGATVALLLALTSAAPARFGGALPALTLPAVRAWAPLTLLFVGMLAASLLALQAVSATTLVVVRNAGTLVVAFFERAVLGTPISTLSVASLLGILAGVGLYGAGDVHFSAAGYAWLAVNVACTAAFQIYVKGLIAGLPREGPGALGPFGMSYYNNAISLPVLVLVALLAGEGPQLPARLAALSSGVWVVVIASALLGFALSTSAFLANKLLSATSMMVANNVNKFALIIVSELAVQLTLGPVAVLATVLVMLSAWVYAQASGSWASGQLHAAFASMGTRRLLTGTAMAAALLAVVSSLIAPPPPSVIVSDQLQHAAHLNSHHVTPPSCAALAGNDSAAYYRCFVPPRVGPSWVSEPGVRSDNAVSYYVSNWSQCPLAAGEPGFKRICNVDEPCAAPLPAATHTYDGLPQTTASGEHVQLAIQRGLRAAWGTDPPHIDLYFRAGCGAVGEIAQLLPTVELFWPEHIGEVIIALDAGNNQTLEYFLPPRWRATRQSYRLVYEDVPCLPGRTFNQVSYLNLDAHSRAQYVVTIDSDCAFHSPVTPDLLFDDSRHLLLPHSRNFQRGAWNKSVEFFTGAGTFSSHTMVSQPVAFARETFPAFRAWMLEHHGTCYFDAVARFHTDSPPIGILADLLRVFAMRKKEHLVRSSFCWMCQLGTFMQVSGRTLSSYNMVDLDDDSGQVYQRMAIHGTYDADETGDFVSSARRAVREGLCRVLGQATLPDCASVDHSYVDRVTFAYADFPWAQPAARAAMRVKQYVSAFRSALEPSSD